MEKKLNTENTIASLKRLKRAEKVDNSYKAKLRLRKVTCYKEQLDAFSYADQSVNSISEENSKYICGTTTFPDNEGEVKRIIEDCSKEIKSLQTQFHSEEEKDKHTLDMVLGEKIISQYPEHCIPINTNVMSFNFSHLASVQRSLTDRLFDVIMIDPPWQLSSSNPTRGVAIAYDTLSDINISTLPLTSLQDEGFLFLWTINAKFSLCFEMMENWGYKFVDDICWIKQSVNGKIAKGHGFYLQHSKETCLIAVKGKPWKRVNGGKLGDCIFSKRRGQSQKPNDIYKMIEELVPGGYYVEIFGRRNNLRDGWVTIGNEL